MAEETKEETEAVPRKVIFDIIAKEAADFYKLIVTVASSFLGGSLVFMEKIAPSPTRLSVWVLLLGWLALVASILSVATVRRLNLDSGKKAMEKKYDEAAKIDTKNEFWSTLSLVLLGLGVVLLSVAAALNLFAIAGGKHICGRCV